jgi:L-amino acid N-acyltransferase YncA
VATSGWAWSTGAASRSRCPARTAGKSASSCCRRPPGRGYGTQAQRLLARYLFAHTTAHRIWAGTQVGNLAEQRALEKAGFTREGVTRATGWRDGAWRDGVIYSLLRTDPAV